MPNNILQPLPLVDYLGPGRGEKKIKWSDREFRKRNIDIAPYWHFKSLWHFVYYNQQSYARIFSQLL